MGRTLLYTAVAVVIWMIAIGMFLITFNQATSLIGSIPEYVQNWNNYNMGRLGAHVVILLLFSFITYALIKFAKRCWNLRTL